MLSSKISPTFLAIATLLLILVLYLHNPIPQYPSYHHFADQRSWLGIPHTWNVVSNIAIALPGIWGLFVLPRKVQFIPWFGVAIGLILTAIGSSYYHLAPDDSRLVWDRLPMTFVFMSIAAALIIEKVSFGLWLWPFLICIGFYSVLFWYTNNDLRFYIGVQAFAILVIIISDLNRDLALVVLCYGLALLFDLYDHQIDKMLGGVVSGHTLKHLAVGLAGAFLIRMVYKRQIHEN